MIIPEIPCKKCITLPMCNIHYIKVHERKDLDNYNETAFYKLREKCLPLFEWGKISQDVDLFYYNNRMIPHSQMIFHHFFQRLNEKTKH